MILTLQLCKVLVFSRVGLINMLNSRPTAIDFDVFQPRNPKASAYYRSVEDHFEQLEAVWDDRYHLRFGFWRPYVTDVIRRYLDCGDLHFGFARVKCEDCGHEYLLAFSCKRRHFCPSCHQKRVVEFGEWLCEEVLKHVPHRQWVFSPPKADVPYSQTVENLFFV
jgi:hypothetical protein